MSRKTKQKINYQELVFKNMSKWTSLNWMYSRYKANIEALKTRKFLKTLSKKEQLEFMRNQSKQANLLIEEFKKTRTNG